MISDNIGHIRSTLPQGVTLVAVSKTYPASDIMEAYEQGQRIFGESRPQELAAKYAELPKDIEWHMIGHLQSNKVKYIASFVSLIHSADSAKLIDVINGEAIKCGRIIDILLEVHIAQEQTKHGWDMCELIDYLQSGVYRELEGVRFCGVMGIATYTDDIEAVKDEFRHMYKIFEQLKHDFFNSDFEIISMGMSGDYLEAVGCGSNMVRVGSSIFGKRN